MQDNKSPQFLSYIPFIYLSWVDNTISPAEWDVMKPYIEEDSQLTMPEKDRLLSYLENGNPPTNEHFTEWKKWMENFEIEINPEDNYPLSTFAQAITSIDDIDRLKAIEKNLDLRPSLYRHALPSQHINLVQLPQIAKEEIKEFFNTQSVADVSKIDDFLSDELFTWKIHRKKEEYRDRVLRQVLKLGKSGYGSLSYPEEYGGKNDLLAYGVVFEKLVAVDPSIAVRYGVQYGLFGGSIASLGTRKHHEKWLDKIGRGEILGGFAMTEMKHGSNVRHLQTRAVYREKTQSFIINTPTEYDHKEFIGNALTAQYVTVFAQLINDGKSYGVHALVVPVRDDNGDLLSGIRVEDNGYKLGLNGVDNGKIWFGEVEVSRFNLLDRFGAISEDGHYSSPIDSEGKRFFTMLGTLIGGRICVGKGAIKGAQYGLALACRYSLKRRQFGQDNQTNEELIIDYPSHQKRLIPRIARSLTLHRALETVAEEFVNAEAGETRTIESEVAALKASATWYAIETLQECREACGGKGYFLQNRIAGMRSDVDIFTTFEGDNTVLIQLAAKGVLSEFQEQFSSGDFTSVMRYLGLQFQSTISSLNPIYRRRTEKEHLRDSRFHRHAVNYRLEEMKMSLASRLRSLIQREIDPYDAFLRVQNHVIAVGNAYADYLEIERFYSSIENELEDKNTNTSEIISNLGTLSSLTVIYNHNDWYLRKGYINGSKSKAIRNQIEQLCLELRPYLGDLTKCFHLPEYVLDVEMNQNSN